MSNAVSALQGVSYSGMAQVVELGLQGMITLRGDFSDADFAAAVHAATGLALPDQRKVMSKDAISLVWMSPDELLIALPHSEADDMVAKLSAALGDLHHMVVNVSDARAVFEISGAGAREALAKLAPVDLSPTAFDQGIVRRTRIAQVPAAFWMTGPDTFHLVAFRSVAQYVFDVLTVSAAEGSEAGFF